MNETTGKVFSIKADNKSVPGCTVSKTLCSKENFYITHFSFAPETDLGAEYYYHPSIFIVSGGKMKVVFPESTSGENQLRSIVQKEKTVTVSEGECIITPAESFYGIKAEGECIYTEIGLSKESQMNSAVKGKDVFALKDLLPYQAGKIVNMDVVNEDKTKFVLMSFDAGCALPSHAAPGEAIIFALDGKGIISYEGKDYEINAGENFVFEKGGMHAVKAVSQFKMALLLTL